MLVCRRWVEEGGRVRESAEQRHEVARCHVGDEPGDGFRV